MATNNDAGQALTPDPAIMRRMLPILPKPYEVRVLNIRRGGPCRLYAKTYNGFFDDDDAAVEAVRRITGRDAAGVYVTINELAPHVLNWGRNRLAEATRAAQDADVVRLRYLFLDFDPIRPDYTNATTDERQAAIARAGQVNAYLDDAGWPGPVWAGTSGSGAMGLYPLDLPPEDSTLVARVLATLSERFTDGAVKLDAGVFNPARVVRLAGTVNAKSATPQADRPWRLATGHVPKGARS